MLKLFIFISILLTGAYSGPIKSQVEFINKGQSVTLRIERKLDLILQQYIKEEEAALKRERELDDAIDKAKKGIDKSKSWLKRKANEMLQSEPLLKKAIESNSSTQ